MDSQAVIRWIMSWCLGVLRRSQAKTLSQLVAAGMTMDRTSPAALGRSLSRFRSVAVKHCIKRVDRFVGNTRIEPSAAMRPDKPGCWCSSNRPGQCSFFTIGRIMLEKIPLKLPVVMPALRKEILCQNWG